jgi:hypothetical protein
MVGENPTGIHINVKELQTVMEIKLLHIEGYNSRGNSPFKEV